MKTLPDITVVPVKSEDLSLLREISIATFTQTFASQNSESNMLLYISGNLNEDTLRSEFANPHSLFYFAYVQNTLAGYLKLNLPHMTANPDKPQLMEIERIYVLSEFQGKAVGKHLLEFSKQVAVSHHLKGIWLGVWEHNLKALQFYKKNNFVQTDSHVFKLGDDEQTDIIMEFLIN